MCRARVHRGLALLGLVLFGCGDRTPSAPAGRFDGVELTIQLPADSPFEDALALRLTEWRTRTGGAAVVVRPDDPAAPPPPPDLLVAPGADWPILASGPGLDDELISNPALGLGDFALLFRTVLTRVEDKVFAVPLGANGLVLWYRADLFDAEANQSTYKSQTGRDLEPPNTWDEYLASARFFMSEGIVPHGCAEAMDDSAASARNFLAHCAAYAKAPDWSSFAIDTETGKPRLDSPPFRRGLEDWLAARDHSPARGGARVSDDTARAAFLSGQAAMLLSSTPPPFPPAAPIPSALAANDAPIRIGVAPLPGSKVVYSPRGGSRSGGAAERDKLNRCAFLGDTGWFVGFGKPGPSPAARHLFIFLAGTDASEYLVQAARHGLVPARTSLLAQPQRFTGYRLPESVTRRYFSLIAEGYQTDNWVTEPRAAGAKELLASLGRELARILAGQVAPAEGLAAANREWQAIIDRNPGVFLEQYRASLGLPALIR